MNNLVMRPNEPKFRKILWGPQMSESNFITIHPKVVDQLNGSIVESLA